MLTNVISITCLGAMIFSILACIFWSAKILEDAGRLYSALELLSGLSMALIVSTAILFFLLLTSEATVKNFYYSLLLIVPSVTFVLLILPIRNSDYGYCFEDRFPIALCASLITSVFFELMFSAHQKKDFLFQYPFLAWITSIGSFVLIMILFQKIKNFVKT